MLKQIVEDSTNILSLHPEYKNIEIKSFAKEISPKKFEVNVFTSLKNSDEKREFGKKLGEINSYLKRNFDITIEYHQYNISEFKNQHILPRLKEF